MAPDGSDERRGRALLSATPSPHLFLGGAVTGYSAEGDGINSNAPDKTAGPDAGSLTAERLTGEPLSRAAISARVRALGVSGARGVWMDYDVWPVQVDAVVQAAAPLHLGVIGELGFTSYPYAIRAGVGAFVHNQRYQSAFAKPATSCATQTIRSAPAATRWRTWNAPSRRTARRSLIWAASGRSPNRC